VTFEKTTYADLPHKFEAGTPNIADGIALGTAIDYMNSIGFENIQQQEKALLAYATEKLLEIEGLKIYGTAQEKTSVISFNIEGLSSEDVGFILSRKYGIITRTGLHCAPLVHEKIDGGAGSVRISLSCFTTHEECKTAADAVLEIAKNAASRFNSA
jgi:cysteine desulfurase/selenocysteine lyase